MLLNVSVIKNASCVLSSGVITRLPGLSQSKVFAAFPWHIPEQECFSAHFNFVQTELNTWKVDTWLLESFTKINILLSFEEI